MDAEAVVARINALERPRGYLLVGIGGHGAAGKSTLAQAIPDAQIVSTDEFWDGSDFDLDRLRHEVLEPLQAGREARFHGFDWAEQAPHADLRVVRPEGVVVIEGVCALHRTFRGAYDLKVWVEAPRAVRLSRALARDGEEARTTWEEVWMPMEDRYVARDDPVAAADLVVDGTGPTTEVRG